jgi:hypothetical protein
MMEPGIPGACLWVAARVAADMGMSQHGVRNLIGVALDMVESCGADRVRLEGAAANVASSTGEAVCAGAGA